ncbi:baseplate multidomain protein megatron [Ostreiculturibacter nitratireducens]|uniref:baseplate multidomain protein megatron n=1 Tax=Ostreiculturibacter nitratireducens TaxID=3075226 RepID=UPI0031B5E51D
MATILLSAAGAAVGAGFGGTVLGLSGAVIGRAVGATLGRVIDQRLLGAGSQAVETGRIDRFRLTGASEGTPVGRVWGRMRLSGQIIWASRFKEQKKTSGGGKGAPTPKAAEYSYSVSLAIALCEGEITRVGRIWADGVEIARDDVTMRVYTGSEDQLPDPKVEAVEGAGEAPAYRGIAYVVFEDLALSRFGNRVPQFSFEVIRSAQGTGLGAPADLAAGVQAVSMIPGTGEYALATTPVTYSLGIGLHRSANINSPSGKTDFATSLEELREELPGCGSVSLVVSWFGDDLRCGACSFKPKVEDRTRDGKEMPWRVSGLSRKAAEEVPRVDGRSVYGGTPADASVIEAIQEIRAGGQSVMFYPFILMDQLAGNDRPDPWNGTEGQPVLPWRGRITCSVAPGREGTPDRTDTAVAEVEAFFGTASITDFDASGATVIYTGPDEWSYRRFILHYAHLCAVAGGVDAFCIGSEMRGLTQIRGGGDTFPTVAAMRQLAVDVRAILGPECRIGYAADWTEYYGYQTPEGDLRYHLDPLWADPNIDFVGIDNYMPISDWRDGDSHADAEWGAIYSLDYLKANIEGGEGYDWYYDAPAHRDAQTRTPITDGAYGEPWVWRVKDIRNWWRNEHHERIGGVREAAATDWVPESKPIWFTEIGCAAIDKGTNEPNKFLDPKSSESNLPHYSNGRRDDLVQMQYLRAMFAFWGDPAKNPVSTEYGSPMVDMSRAHVWAWDARPYPVFPNDTTLWSDGTNYSRGHWINGRTSGQPVAKVVEEICLEAGLQAVDTDGLHGVVRGYSVTDVETARASIQPLMLVYGFDAAEREGKLVFSMRDGRVDARLSTDGLARTAEIDGAAETQRAPNAEIAGRVRLAYVEAEGDYETKAVEAVFPDEEPKTTDQTEFPLALTRAEAQRTVERWLNEARVARDTARFALPPSMSWLGAGDVVELVSEEGARSYRVDRAEHAGALVLEAVRVEGGVYEPSDETEERIVPRAFVAPVPVTPIFLDLPLITGEEVPHAPHLAVAAVPWPGSVAVWSSTADEGYELNSLIPAGSAIGETLTPLFAASPGVWDRGAPLRVRLTGGEFSSANLAEVFNGANLAAIGDGHGDNWELFQFASATLVEPNVWDLSLRLRGQAGTDALQPPDWPIGSIVVLLNDGPRQINLPLSARGLARHYRVGTALRGYDDATYVHEVRAFSGIGLRPYSPCHLRARRLGSEDISVSWVRRTRIDGDSWFSLEVPLAEESERYLVRVVQGSTVRREITLLTPSWTYSAMAQASDGLDGPFSIYVAQLSDSFGPGPFTRIEING